MTNRTIEADVVVIGGGLAGIFATLRLARDGIRVVLVDNPLPEASNSLGGFARFSGAKFSLPPAGLGLLPVAGSLERLNDAISRILEVLGLVEHASSESLECPSGEGGVIYRRYHSILLSPDQINKLLDKLTAVVATTTMVVRGKAMHMERSGSNWEVTLSEQGNPLAQKIVARTIFYAAGRLSEGLLLEAGAVPSEGKGLDIGVRLEFLDKDAISELRKLGADAKILHGSCRTFCLNSPGQIYRYPYKKISIPGGIVADSSSAEANVGILLRVANKEQKLQEILATAEILQKELLEESMSLQKKREGRSMPKVLAKVFGAEETEILGAFIEEIANRNLIDTKQPHRIHMPLLDWHWHTFATPSSHLTNLPEVYALGDSSGHARGLLQASVSGWLAAEEYLCSS